MKKRILCVDDSNTALLLLEYALTEAGYDCVTAHSVEEAKNSLKEQLPDLILLDLSMPDVSGYDFLGMRKDMNLQNVKIIVVSAYDSVESVSLAKSLGIDDFISKPIKIGAVLNKIRFYLDR
jgi:DNA-binding response OmpR family regulator